MVISNEIGEGESLPRFLFEGLQPLGYLLRKISQILTNVCQHMVASNAINLNRATRGQMGEAHFDFTLDIEADLREQGLELQIQSISAMDLPHQVQNSQAVLLWRACRSPLPSCCKKTVRLSVGLRKRTVFISGTSRPSLSTSRVNRKVSRPARSSLSKRERVGASVSPTSTADAIPCMLNASAMNSACETVTQKPIPRTRERLGSYRFKEDMTISTRCFARTYAPV